MCSALKTDDRLRATIVERVVQTPDVVSLKFTTSQPLNYQAGQCVSVYFDETGVREGRAYSLSSCPSDPKATITVKKVGLFSGKLHDLKVGDKLSISRPYGYFGIANNDNRPIVALASGVGVAPIWSVVRHESEMNSQRPITLFYSNRTDSDIVFCSGIDDLAKESKNLMVQYFLTRQDSEFAETRRIDVAQDLTTDQLKDSYFLVCGSLNFVRGMWQQLIAAGVSESDIMSETFFEAL